MLFWLMNLDFAGGRTVYGVMLIGSVTIEPAITASVAIDAAVDGELSIAPAVNGDTEIEQG